MEPLYNETVRQATLIFRYEKPGEGGRERGRGERFSRLFQCIIYLLFFSFFFFFNTINCRI